MRETPSTLHPSRQTRAVAHTLQPHQNALEGLKNPRLVGSAAVPNSVSGVGLRMCLSNKFSGNAGGDGLRTALGKHRLAYTVVTNDTQILGLFSTHGSYLSQASCSSALCHLLSRSQCDGTASDWNVASPHSRGQIGRGKLWVSS